MDGKNLCRTPYAQSGSRIDMFNNVKQPRLQPSNNNMAMNRADSNSNMANIGNASFAAGNLKKKTIK